MALIRLHDFKVKEEITATISIARTTWPLQQERIGADQRGIMVAAGTERGSARESVASRFNCHWRAAISTTETAISVSLLSPGRPLSQGRLLLPRTPLLLVCYNCYLLFHIYYLLFTIYCLLFIVYCLLFIIRRVPIVVVVVVVGNGFRCRREERRYKVA